MSAYRVSPLFEVPPAERAAIASDEELARIGSHRPDGSLAALDGERAVARCSVWWSEVPSYDGRRVGFVGHYKAESGEAGDAVLRGGCNLLRGQGCEVAIGPIDGNTWRNYRFVIDVGTAPPFLLEPSNPPRYVEDFRRVGFQEIASYFSALSTSFTTVDPSVLRAEMRILSSGVVIRPLESEEFERDLDRIYAVSIDAFKENFLYTPIGRDEFVSQYARLLSLIDPRFVLLALKGSDPVGFLFAIPDISTQSEMTLIVKTVAVRKGREFAGLGNVLVARCQILAAEVGFKRVIHALMHESNSSKNLSARYGAPMRTYGLFSRVLSP